METIERSNSVYFTKFGQPTPRLEQCWEVPNNSNLEFQLGKGPGQCIHPTGETSNYSFGGFHLESQAAN